MREPREHGIADTCGHAALVTGERFGYEEWIAAGNRVKLIHAFPGARRKLIDCAFRKHGQTKTSHRRPR